ncbi:hypothetical protein MSAN_01136100 [Mycena sanguinolenta]|uniref:Uncharacterized protein n=1 Tax=Mycena sanguinolenta TaxID=230812 RepID=A0A8H6YGZ9_9AGAR|nr:hypothetical protein MSAN_01136100 [Mycena sanguinolenta]
MNVLIDDNSPLVQYSPGGWFRAGQPPEFDATTHSSVTQGNTAGLVFVGTSISVYGTLARSSGHSILNFSIDGGNNDSYRAPIVHVPVHNQLFWTSPVFNEMQHTLVVTVDQPSATYYLDYFIYTTRSPAGNPQLIDDTDASITYSPGGWQSDHSTDSCLESTRHVSKSAGSWATASFNGTGISLFGPPGQKGFNASIVVDGSQPTVVQSQTAGNQLFNRSNLPSGPHVMNITVLEGSPLGIDYFFVTSAGSPASAAPQSQSTPVSSAAPVPSATPASSVTSPSGSSKTPPVSAIVGGAVGGLALLFLILVAVLVMWRRRTRRVDPEHPAPMTPPTLPIR